MIDEKKLTKKLVPLVKELREGKRPGFEINLAGDTRPYRKFQKDFYVVPLYVAAIDFGRSTNDEAVRVLLRWFTTIEKVWDYYSDFVAYAIVPFFSRIEALLWKEFVKQRLVVCVSCSPSSGLFRISHCLVIPEKYRQLAHLISAVSRANTFKYHRGWAVFDITTSDLARHKARSFARYCGFITLHSAVKASVPLGSLVSWLSFPLTCRLEKSVLSFIYQLLRRKDLYTEL